MLAVLNERTLNNYSAFFLIYLKTENTLAILPIALIFVRITSFLAEGTPPKTNMCNILTNYFFRQDKSTHKKTKAATLNNLAN